MTHLVMLRSGALSVIRLDERAAPAVQAGRCSVGDHADNAYALIDDALGERGADPASVAAWIESLPGRTLKQKLARFGWERRLIIRGLESRVKRVKQRAGKPPYRVPSMREIAAVPKTAGTAVSTFSGCGGSCLGLEMAGFRVLWASEFVLAAREVYELNHPGVPVDARDVRDVSAGDVLRATGLAVGELDLLEGSPPCASFSTAGKRSAGWGKVKKYSDMRQRTDDLFFEFARLLRGIQPRAFVAENVAGLVRGVAKGYFKLIMRELKSCGYRVRARVLDAQWLGVPQSRRRVIFVGAREDLDREPTHPAPLPYFYTVADACPWMTNVPEDDGRSKTRLITKKAAPTIRAQGAATIFACESIVDTCLETEAERLGPGERSEKYFNLVRARADRLSPTILASHGRRGAAGPIHPTEKRKFTIAELKRVCGFPDDFRLTGSYAQQWERLGRAVPPPMMRAVGEAVRKDVLE